MARVEAVEFVAEVCCQRTVKRRRPKVVLRQIHMIRIGLINEAAAGKRFGKVDFDRDFTALRRRPDVLAVGQDEILRALRGAAGGKRQGGGRGALSASFRDGVFAAAVKNQRVGFFF